MHLYKFGRRAIYPDMASPSRPRSDTTRQQLLEAAERILLTQGVQALTVRNVGAVSGLNSTLVTYHFGTINGLLRELALCNMTPMTDHWRDLSTSPKDIRSLLTCWLTPLTFGAAFNPDGRALIVLDEIAAHGSDGLSEEVLEAMIKINERVREALAPLVPHLDGATLQARLRFIAGAALGPPPRVPEADITNRMDLAKLLDFAEAALC